MTGILTRTAWPRIIFQIEQFCSAKQGALGQSSRCGLLELQHATSVTVVCRLGGSMACGIFPDQGLRLQLLNWQKQILTHCTARAVLDKSCLRCSVATCGAQMTSWGRETLES